MGTGVLMANLVFFVGIFSAFGKQILPHNSGPVGKAHAVLRYTGLPPRSQATPYKQMPLTSIHQQYNALHGKPSNTLKMYHTSTTRTHRLAANGDRNLNTFLHPLQLVPVSPLGEPTAYQKMRLTGHGRQGRIPTLGSVQLVVGPRQRQSGSHKSKRRVEFVDNALFKNHISLTYPSNVDDMISTSNAIDSVPSDILTSDDESSQMDKEVKDTWSDQILDTDTTSQTGPRDVIPLPLPLPLPPRQLPEQLKAQEKTSDVSHRQTVASLKSLLLTLTVLRYFDSDRQKAMQILDSPGMLPSLKLQSKRQMFNEGSNMFRNRPFDSLANGLIGKRSNFRKRPFDSLASGLIGK